MRYLMLLPLLLLSALSHAETVWLNDQWDVVDAEAKASYYLRQHPVEQDGRWPITLYYKGSETPRYTSFLNGPSLQDDLLVGAFTFYHANGQISSVGQRSDSGQHEGVTRFYDDAGVLTHENSYRNGEPHGLQKSYQANGQLDRIYWADQGKATGVDAHYYEDGSLKSTHSLHNNEAHGEQNAYYPDGQLRERTHYTHGVQLGEKVRYHADGQLAYRATYSAEGLDGTSVSYYKDGQMQREDVMRKGKRHGLARFWAENGQLTQATHYRNDKRHGESRHYDANGMLERLEHYENSREIGEQRRYHSGSEQVQRISHYDQQHRLTRQQHFEPNGEMSQDISIRYRQGHAVRDSRYFEAGVLSRRQQNDDGRDWQLTERFDAEGTLVGREERLGYSLEGLYLTRGDLGWTGPAYEQRVNYQNGRQHGDYERRLLSGELLEQGEYAEGVKVGRWEYRDDYSHRIEHFNRKGQYDGEQRYLMPDGQLKRLAHYRNDQLQGAYEEYDEDGRLIAKGSYQDNQRHGAWQHLDDYELQHLLWQGEYHQGDKVGDWVAHSAAGYVTGREQYDDQGCAQGAFYYFTDEGLLTGVARYRDGERHGSSISYINGRAYSCSVYDQGSLVSEDCNDG
ncbi:antitoxin component YwqK of YwqJK toxin-antitoxin module [Marinobacterium halophilum]|uniref:Antitoxin component YwqK of YwqJK toxin-antitoxin module n=1 Tax=Marinobacterium halophilum TaxID=267374 RepID=A0A2P8ELC3_9GAMM|nr:toxin-antitoxin system YwqK family antitoxin [Marinobacterium halophilum]PSL10259.1 antitoxin component YwqK of YwqJK toxin-antitoxin module [Marinobacterium halophilum]